MLEHAEQPGARLAGRDGEQMAAPVELHQRRERAGKQRLAHALPVAQRPPGGPIGVGQQRALGDLGLRPPGCDRELERQADRRVARPRPTAARARGPGTPARRRPRSRAGCRPGCRRNRTRSAGSCRRVRPDRSRRAGRPAAPGPARSRAMRSRRARSRRAARSARACRRPGAAGGVSRACSISPAGAPSGQAAGPPYLRSPRIGVPSSGAVDAQLMGAAGERLQGEPARDLAGAGDGPVAGAGRLAVGDALDALAPSARLLGERPVDQAVGDRRPADHQRPVQLVDPMAAERLGQLGRGGRAVLATTRRPLVSRSSRCTRRGRSPPPASAASMPSRWRGVPVPPWTASPAGLFRTSSASSSCRISERSQSASRGLADRLASRLGAGPAGLARAAARGCSGRRAAARWPPRAGRRSGPGRCAAASAAGHG